MKTFLTICLLATSFFNFAQSYSMPKNAITRELPGSSFLMAYSEGSYVFIKEIDENLGELWADSLTMSPYSDSIYINNIMQFGNTDEYLLTTKRVISTNYPSPSYLWTSPYNWDYEFSILSLSNQGITSSIRDTFNTIGSVFQMELDDSLIYTMTKQTMVCSFIPQFQCNPFTISSSLNYGNPQNLLNCIPQTSNSLDQFDGDIQWFFVHQDEMKMMYYDSLLNYQGSMFESIPTSIVSASPNPYNKYQKRLNRDSILVLNEWTTSSGSGYWQLNFFSEDLHTINSIEMLPPTAPNGQNYRIHRAVLAGEYLYILGLEEVPGVDHWTVFVYDLNMNLQCEISATPWAAQNTASSKSIVTINDKAYFTLTDANKQDWFEVFCSANTIGEMNELSKISIYPNPAKDKIKIQTNGMLTVSGISIVDVNGRLIRKLSSDAQEIAVQDLQNGMYLLKVEFENGVVAIERFVKE